MFRGNFVAMVTPFKKNSIDWKSFERLVSWLLEGGADGLVPCATTGEAATLTHEEHLAVVKETLRLSGGKVPVIAGCGTNDTAKAIKLAQELEALKVDALLAVTPYYNKPTQRGLYEHFRVLASSVKAPIVLYNVPSRTGVHIEPATVCALAKNNKNIVGIKEASGLLDQVTSIIRDMPDGFSVLSGDDSLTLPMLACGAKGVVSVVANAVPRQMSELVASFEMGDLEKAKRLHLKLYPLFKTLFIETNPIPVKTALYKMGVIDAAEFRLPLVSMAKDNEEKLTRVLQELNLLQKAKIRA